jgi:N-acetylneuraminate synthase
MKEIIRDVLFVAEVSANHLGNLDRALKIIEAAASSGANAVKFQTYTADTMTLDLDSFAVSDDHELWGGRNLYELYNEAHTPWEWHPKLFARCRDLGVIPFSSPFDSTAVDFLESLDAPMYKIASLETGDHELIRKVAATGKPLIISTGATHWDEIAEAVKVVEQTGNKNLTLLVCTSSYPAEPKDAHINRMKTISENFNVKVGLSDHSLGIGVSIAAITLGATVIERHLTLRRSDGGADGAFSMEPDEFKSLVREGTSARESLGFSQWSIQDSEEEARKSRRSLYVTKNVVAGEILSRENIRAIRPGGGALPKDITIFLGKKFKEDTRIGTPLSENIVE